MSRDSDTNRSQKADFKYRGRVDINDTLDFIDQAFNIPMTPENLAQKAALGEELKEAISKNNVSLTIRLLRKGLKLSEFKEELRTNRTFINTLAATVQAEIAKPRDEYFELPGAAPKAAPVTLPVSDEAPSRAPSAAPAVAPGAEPLHTTGLPSNALRAAAMAAQGGGDSDNEYDEDFFPESKEESSPTPRPVGNEETRTSSGLPTDSEGRTPSASTSPMDTPSTPSSAEPAAFSPSSPSPIDSTRTTPAVAQTPAQNTPSPGLTGSTSPGLTPGSTSPGLTPGSTDIDASSISATRSTAPSTTPSAAPRGLERTAPLSSASLVAPVATLPRYYPASMQEEISQRAAAALSAHHSMSRPHPSALPTIKARPDSRGSSEAPLPIKGGDRVTGDSISEVLRKAKADVDQARAASSAPQGPSLSKKPSSGLLP